MGVVSDIPASGSGIGRFGGGVIRLMVVDDSAIARAVFARIIAREADMELVSVAGTAEEALETLRTTRVDVILLDLEMPGMGGLEALPQMINSAPCAQVLVVSSLTVEGAEPTLEAMRLGAADTLAKPRPGAFDDFYRERLLGKIRALGRKQLRADLPVRMRDAARPALRSASRKPAAVLAIGASTGGIHALGALLTALPRRIGIPILVTQHLPASFMDAFVRQLENAANRHAALAFDGAVLQPDEILVAPGDAHLTVRRRGEVASVKLDRTPAASGCMPSVDPMFASLAPSFGGNALGVVLSGMGRDGLEGARAMVGEGGTILAQDEASCAVWGMPGAIATAGLASAICPPEQLADRITASALVS